MKYTVLHRPATERQLSRLDAGMLDRIMEAIAGLADNPRPFGSLKMAGCDLYRIRVGEYRVVYEIHDRIVTVMVVAIGHRKDVYR